MDQSPMELRITGSAEQVAIAWAGMLRLSLRSPSNADRPLAPVRQLRSVHGEKAPSRP